MKKYIALIALFGFVLFSCSKSPIVEPQAPAESGYYTFTLNANADVMESVTDGSETKSYYGADEVSFNWSANDEISVLFHKGEDHKFFTLKTTTGGSSSASFSGTIDEGYVLGASETESVNQQYWALFPASANHSWNTETHLPDFYEAPEVDYTKSHFSANIPMYANGDADGNFSFKYLTSCYKFTFTDIDAQKVKLSVHSASSGGWYLSGKSPIKIDGSTYYLQCYDGTGSRDVSYIEAVDATEKKAVFYVPFRGWETFKPQLTLTNVDNGATLLSVTAKSALAAASFGKIVVLPAKSLSGISVFVPKINIDGDMSDWDGIETASTNDSNNYRVFKATFDSKYIYLYTKRVTVSGQRYIYYDFDLDNDPSTGATEGSRTGLEAYMALVLYNGDTINENPGADACSPNSSVYAGIVCKGTVGAEFSETELSIPRTNLNIQNGDVIKIYSWGNKSADGVASKPIVLTITN